MDYEDFARDQFAGRRFHGLPDRRPLLLHRQLRGVAPRLYTENGAPRLLWNLFLGIAGAFLAGLAIEALGLASGVIWLLAVGPIVALLSIVAGQAGWRAVVRRRGR